MVVRKKSSPELDTSLGRHWFHPTIPRLTFTGWMNKQEFQPLNVQSNGDDETALEIEQYRVNHPESPSAVRRPKVFRQGDTFVVLLGRDLQNGIVGLGNTVESALRAFDLQYCNALRPRMERTLNARSRRRTRT